MHNLSIKSTAPYFFFRVKVMLVFILWALSRYMERKANENHVNFNFFHSQNYTAYWTVSKWKIHAHNEIRTLNLGQTDTLPLGHIMVLDKAYRIKICILGWHEKESQ